MFHMYEVETQNEGFDWHIYAKNLENARQIFNSFDNFITQECRNLEKMVNYRYLMPGLKADAEYSNERQEIEKFFSRFYKPVIRQEGIMGGYVLDYRQCSVKKKVEMPYDIMLSYLDTISDNKFFAFADITPVYAGYSEIDMPYSDSDMNLIIGMDKRFEYGNEVLLAAAGAELGFQAKYIGEDKYRKNDIFRVGLKGMLQFCQLLNYMPFVEIVNISYE